MANNLPARSMDRPRILDATEKRCATTKAMIFLLPKGPIGIGMAVQPRGTRRGQAVKEMPEPDRDKTDFG
ncbi:hypothetical protein [Mycobacterium colombiense]|uniref:hypothetical protein n=1 Tax=Mycobacterium colombiense TaxID=339268 RepID=UPI00140207B6